GGRPEQQVVRGAAADAARGLADRGVRAGPLTCGQHAAGGRFVRGYPGEGDDMTFVAPATVAIVLAQQPGSGDNGGQGEDFGKSSPVGFLLLLIFLIAVALLVRSMTKHLKRVPASFDPPEAA